MRLLELGRIRIDGGTQPREAIDQATVDEYADSMARLERFPPLVVYHDGVSTWLADGFHRYHAARKFGAQSVDVDWREGTLEMAKLYAASANRAHGLRRTPGDKRRAIEMALSTDEGRRWSQEQIAKHCGVAQSYVAKVVGENNHSDKNPQPKPTVAEVKRAAVAAAVAGAPAASNREIARKTGVDHKTVAAVREEAAREPAPAPPPEPPRPRAYSTCNARDTARAILDGLRIAGSYTRADRDLLIEQMHEVIDSW